MLDFPMLLSELTEHCNTVPSKIIVAQSEISSNKTDQHERNDFDVLTMPLTSHSVKGDQFEYNALNELLFMFHSCSSMNMDRVNNRSTKSNSRSIRQ